MSELRKIYDTIRTWVQFIKFSVVALLGFIITISLTTLLTEVGEMHYLLSFLVGLIGSWVIVFLLNFVFTFDGHPQTHVPARLSIFLLIYLIVAGVNVTVIYILTSLLGLQYVLSIILACTATVLLTFNLVKRFVFRD